MTAAFDVHRHFALSTGVYDLFQVPEREQFHAWEGLQTTPKTPGVLMPPPYYALPAGIDDTRRLNDLAAHLQSNGSGRLKAFGVVEAHHGDAALEEVERIGSELPLAGIAFAHRAQGVFADMPVMSRILRRAGALGLVCAVHASPLSGNESLWRIWRLVESAPETKVIALGALSDWDHLEQVLANARRAPNLFYDTSELTETAGSLARLVDAVGVDRILFGTGAHRQRDAETATSAEEFGREAALPDAAVDAILWDNASNMFGVAA